MSPSSPATQATAGAAIRPNAKSKSRSLKPQLIAPQSQLCQQLHSCHRLRRLQPILGQLQPDPGSTNIITSTPIPAACCGSALNDSTRLTTKRHQMIMHQLATPRHCLTPSRSRRVKQRVKQLTHGSLTQEYSSLSPSSPATQATAGAAIRPNAKSKSRSLKPQLIAPQSQLCQQLHSCHRLRRLQPILGQLQPDPGSTNIITSTPTPAACCGSALNDSTRLTAACQKNDQEKQILGVSIIYPQSSLTTRPWMSVKRKSRPAWR